MDSPPPVYQARFFVRSYEIDARRRARVRTITNYIQECAVRHALALGVGKHQLPGNLTWMLGRLHVRMDRWPAWREEIDLETWPSGLDRLYAYRDFLFHHEGERIGAATSAWVMVDEAKRRTVRMPPVIHSIPRPDRPRSLDDPFERLPEIESPEGERRYEVHWGQVDVNYHANQSAYVDWAIDALPDEVHTDSRPLSLEIAFRREARRGESVLSRFEAAGTGTYHHLLARESDGAELARLRTRWATGD